MISKKLDTYIEELIEHASEIHPLRKEVLNSLADYISEKVKSAQPVNLLFICTHNSRRSHFAQIWAQVAAYYIEIPGVKCYSGGTEATAFNTSAVAALKRTGISVLITRTGPNPVYQISFDDKFPPVVAFSKTYFDEYNPQEGFAAIMTCSDADEACPHVPGADSRFSLKYDDPKAADGTPEEESVYDQRCREIGTEMFFVFKQAAIP